FFVLAPALAAAIAIVNPLREFLSQDDGWAYARMVEHLLKTGAYQLDAWSAANMPVQIYFAGGLAKVFGYSLGLLRIATLLLLVAGLAAFVALLRELDVEPPAAAVLALGLLASPLVAMLSFTFMSDVQFMGWLLIATWLYVRGTRRGSDATVLLASLAAGCAIGTRQFGVAVIGGLLLAGLLARPTQRPPWRRLLLGAAIPLVVGLWQLRAGYIEPNFTQAVRLHEQRWFLTRPPLAFARETAWRIGTVVHYVALSMLPVLPLLLALVVRRPAPRLGVFQPDGRPRVLIALTVFALLLIASLDKSAVTTRENSGRALQLYWMLPNSFWQHDFVMHGLAFAGTVGTFLLVVLLLKPGARAGSIRDLPFGWLLAGSIGASLFALHLVYVQLNDTYVVGLLPFALLIPARALATGGRPPRTLAACAALSVAMLVLVSLWMRGSYNWQEAQWRAADRLLASGIKVSCIGASRHWTEYHGAFDEWLALTYPNFDHTRGDRSPAQPGSLHGPFYAWLHQRYWSGTHQVAVLWKSEPASGWRRLAGEPYRDARFVQRTVDVYERMEPTEAVAGC
ncbi:MAG: glycosyltransferase family 39 protein, partial [Caldimonas sp.]